MQRLHTARTAATDSTAAPSAAAGNPDGDATPAASSRRRTRRALLLGGATALASGVAGVALGYRLRTELRDLKLRALAWPMTVPGEMDSFRREAARIDAARARQTAEDVAALKKRYQEP